MTSCGASTRTATSSHRSAWPDPRRYPFAPIPPSAKGIHTPGGKAVEDNGLMRRSACTHALTQRSMRSPGTCPPSFPAMRAHAGRRDERSPMRIMSSLSGRATHGIGSRALGTNPSTAGPVRRPPGQVGRLHTSDSLSGASANPRDAANVGISLERRRAGEPGPRRRPPKWRPLRPDRRSGSHPRQR
jgi:hypothetical protein